MARSPQAARITAFALALVLLPLGAPSLLADHESVQRIAGSDRVRTSTAISLELFDEPVDTVVLATALAPADALAGAPLVAALGAPLLLTPPDGLHPAVRAEIRRLRPGVVVLLGGQAALGRTVEEEVRALDAEPRRIAGRDRFATAAAIATELRTHGELRHAYLVEGAHPDPRRGWPDAVSVAGLAATLQLPVLLATRDAVPPATLRALVDLRVDHVTLVGGTGALSTDVEQQLRAEGYRVDRIAGATRYETSLRLAEATAQALPADPPTWVATGHTWPDALTAGPAAARVQGVVLLAPRETLSDAPPARTWLESGRTSRAVLVGGDASLSPTVEEEIRRLFPPRDEHPLAAIVPDAVLVAAAGDIACDPADEGFAGGEGTATRCRQRDTAALLEDRPYEAVLALGDLQYTDATLEQFLGSYHRSWGQVRHVTRPVPGNHEYQTPGAAGYLEYFGRAARPAGATYYRYELNGWLLLAMDSNCDEVGGCGVGSPHERWLREQLQAAPSCTLAYMHHPRFSSGRHGGSVAVAPLFQALYEAGADIVLSGHDHAYERFAPQNPRGRRSTAYGVRQFVVGTGGAYLYPPGAASHNSEVRENATFGVLELELAPASYRWEFRAVPGSTFTDSGHALCHGRPRR